MFLFVTSRLIPCHLTFSHLIDDQKVAACIICTSGCRDLRCQSSNTTRGSFHSGGGGLNTGKRWHVSVVFLFSPARHLSVSWQGETEMLPRVRFKSGCTIRNFPKVYHQCSSSSPVTLLMQSQYFQYRYTPIKNILLASRMWGVRRVLSSWVRVALDKNGCCSSVTEQNTFLNLHAC